MLRRSGYSERFRHEVIGDSLRGYEKLLKGEAEGGRPVDRPKRYQQLERRRRRQEKGGRWYRREARGTRMRDGIIIIPPTPQSVMAKALRKICQEELKGTNISMGVTERGGRTLGQELGCTLPGRARKEHCGRIKCFPCNTGSVGLCRRTGVGYQIDCIVCENINIESIYAGETGKNLYMRGCNYVADVEKKEKINLFGSTSWKSMEVLCKSPCSLTSK